MNNDRAVGLLALAIAAIYYYFASDIPRSLLSDEVGAVGLPKLYAVALSLLGIFLVWSSFAVPAGPAPEGEPGANPLQHVRAVGLLLLGAAYLLLISSLGYLLTISLLIAAVALYCGAAFGARVLLISAAGGMVFWLVFVKMFSMPLPAGALWRWLAGG